MNKTVTINISGIIFHIEEDAYDSLSRYMQTIKGYFSSTDGGNEIMGDIEARIAELLQSRINAGKQVILMNDVEHVMGIMGKPEEFGGENKSETKHEEEPVYGKEKIKRRLFRNPDDKAIGGVCSGLAAYFDIDTVWVRLAMFLLIFFGGISLWVYIILWLIIPLAQTTADKFAMRGESANVNTIYRSFKEEAEDVKNRFTKYGKEWRNNEFNDSVRRNTSNVFNGVFNIFGRLIGLFIFSLGALFLLIFLASVFGFTTVNFYDHNLSYWKTTLFASSSDYSLGLFAYFIVAGIPIFMMMYGGIKLMFRIHYSNRWLNMSLGIIWIFGLILGSYVAVTTFKQFAESARVRQMTELHQLGDTIVVKMKPATAVIKDLGFENEDYLEDFFAMHQKWSYNFGKSGKGLTVLGHATLDVEESPSDSVELTLIHSSQGANTQEANENARLVKYNYQQNGNELLFDEAFMAESGSRFRSQDLRIKLRIPKGKVIYFDKSLRYFLYDVDNTTDTWDGDMINRRWIMTEKGLKCIDCKDLEDIAGRHSHEEEEIKIENVTINDKGIHVKDKETEIRIDENGIKIKTPEKNIELKDKNEK